MKLLRSGQILQFVISTAILAVSLLVISPTHANAAELCDNGGLGKCIEAKSLPSSSLTVNNRLAAGYQRLVEIPAYICNGSDGVTSSCPFKVGTGLNNLFKGNVIVEYQFKQNRKFCMTISPVNQVYVQASPCGAIGTYWVVVSNDVSEYNNAIVNKSASDHLGGPAFLTGGKNVNSYAYVQYPYVPGRSDWSYSGN